MITSTWSTWHLLAAVLAVGAVFLFYYVILLLKQVRSTLGIVEQTLSLIQSEVAPVLSHVEGITGNVEQITGRADGIFENVQNKAEDTMGIVDSAKSSMDILKHTMFLALIQVSRYTKALGVGFKVGISHFKGSGIPEQAAGLHKQGLFLPPATSEIVDHLEYLETKPK